MARRSGESEGCGWWIELCFGEKMKQEARRPGKRGPVNG